jgi:hypothetical protein
MRTHLKKIVPCPTNHHNRTRELLLSELERLETTNKQCDKCNVTFQTFQGYVYHCVNNVCTRSYSESQSETQSAENDAMIEADTVEFGEETFDHIPVDVIIQSFRDKNFDPLVIKYTFFSSDAPQNHNVVYLDAHNLAIKMPRGWESRPWRSIIHKMFQRLACSLTARTDINRAVESGVWLNLDSNIKHWRGFMANFSSRSEEYQRVAEDIVHVVKTYTTAEKLAHVKKFLNKRI